MHCPHPGPSRCPFLAQRGGRDSFSMRSRLRGEQLPGPPSERPRRTRFCTDRVASCKPVVRTSARTHLLTRPAPDKPLMCLGHLVVASCLPQSPPLLRRRSALTGGDMLFQRKAAYSRALTPASSFITRHSTACRPRPRVPSCEAAVKALAHSARPLPQARPPGAPT